MHLREYLHQPGSLTISQLRQRMVERGGDIKQDAQIRQWLASEGEADEFKRYPSPANAKLLHDVTKGKISLEAMRPKDWYLIWPALAKKKNASKPVTADGPTANNRRHKPRREGPSRSP